MRNKLNKKFFYIVTLRSNSILDKNKFNGKIIKGVKDAKKIVKDFCQLHILKSGHNEINDEKESTNKMFCKTS